MYKVIVLLSILTVLSAFSPAKAVTVHNLCPFPLAGSLKRDSTGIALYQFRLVPGAKIHMKKHLPEESLTLSVIPDIKNLSQVVLKQKVLTSPDCYIEVKNRKGKLHIHVE